MPKKLRMVTLLCCLLENSLRRKNLWIRAEGNYQDFLSKSFCRTVSEITLGELFTVSLFSGIEKVRIRELGDGRSVKTFRPNCLVPKCRKFSLGNPAMLSFRKFPIAKKFMDKS